MRCGTTSKRSVVGMCATLVLAGCGNWTVVSADLGDSTFSGSLEIRKELDRFADSFIVRASYLSGRGTAQVYGISGDVDCTAENVLVLVGAEWLLYRTARPTGGFGVSLSVPLGWQQVTYDDPGSGESTVGSDVGLLELVAAGVFVDIPFGRRSVLRGAYHYAGVVDEVATEVIVEFRYAVAERMAVSAGWRRLRLETISDTNFQPMVTGTQVVKTDSSGFVVGTVVRF